MDSLRDFLRNYVPGIAAWPIAFFWYIGAWMVLPPEKFRAWASSL